MLIRKFPSRPFRRDRSILSHSSRMTASGRKPFGRHGACGSDRLPEGCVNHRNAVVELHFRVLAHLFQSHPQRRESSDRVAIRPRVRCIRNVPAAEWPRAPRFGLTAAVFPAFVLERMAHSGFGWSSACCEAASLCLCLLRRSTRPSNSSILARTGSEWST